MDVLVKNLILSGGEEVVITFSDGGKVNAVYKATYGYTHYFAAENGGEIKLSNRFMSQKDIDITLKSR